MDYVFNLHGHTMQKIRRTKCHLIEEQDMPSNLLYKAHQIPKLKCFFSHLAVIFAQSIEARCSVEYEDVVGAALTGDAPTTSKWSIISLPNKVQLILQV